MVEFTLALFGWTEYIFSGELVFMKNNLNVKHNIFFGSLQDKLERNGGERVDGKRGGGM